MHSFIFCFSSDPSYGRRLISIFISEFKHDFHTYSLLFLELEYRQHQTGSESDYARTESRSQSKSPAGSPARVKSESRSGSRSPSRASKHSESHSRSRSKSRWMKLGKDFMGMNRENAANPDPNTCLGVFGLSLYTTERDLREVFSRYGPLTGVNVVYDQRTGRSRGFAFVYFERIDDSKEAMEHANGMELDGRRIRVDYSITKRAHTPTPGIYMGRPTHSGGGGGGGAGRRRDSYYDRGYDRGYDRYEEYDYRYRRRSPSPYYSRYRSRSRSRSYSPMDEEGKAVDVVCLDISKAFDTVSHGILLEKLLAWTDDKGTDILLEFEEGVDLHVSAYAYPTSPAVPQPSASGECPSLLSTHGNACKLHIAE
ncbi:hypothetical protein BTVI_146724 [Pitangus sulphuratus]|nr:hypothetical protein BTVI_146724 [Pitangus sulphuratus]